MKRLFRSSKPEISPLPPPPPSSAQASSGPQQHPQQPYNQGQYHDAAGYPAHVPNGVSSQREHEHGAGPNGPSSGGFRKSASGIKLHDSAHPETSAEAPSHGGAQSASGGGGGGGGGGAFRMFGVGRQNQGTVTPFPVDSGRVTDGIKRRVSRKEKKSAAAAAMAASHQAPSLAEMRMSHSVPPPAPPSGPQHSAQGYHGRAPHFATHVQAPSPPPQGGVHPSVEAGMMMPSAAGGRGSREPLASPDAWTPFPPSTHAAADPAYAPLPMPPAPGSASSVTGRHSPSQQQLFLPPGAQPPSPQTLRPVTPTRLPSSLGHSQSSLQSLTQDDAYAHPGRGVGGRDRGYSSASASGRGSDHEGSSAGHGLVSHQPAKLSKGPTGLQQNVRSPLVNAFTDADNTSPPIFPMPQPLQQPVPPPNTNTHAPHAPYPDDLSQAHHFQLQDRAQEREHRDKKDEKPKGRFWGMSFGGDKKDKSGRSGTETPSSIPPSHGPRAADGSRRGSIDAWAGGVHEAQHYSNHQRQHVNPDSREHERGRTSEAVHRPMAAYFTSHAQGQDAAAAKDVNSAIQILCAHPDPSFTAIYDVCDRINHSDSPDSVCKEAARALRKQFKHGNESERRNAARVWLFMMKNISSPSFRTNAASKKFTASLEPILLAPSAKPLVSSQTRSVIADVLADLTWHYGGDKGCEPLGELWRKIKVDGQPDNGRPLPEDHLSFQPEAMYPSRVFDQGQNRLYQSHSDQAGQIVGGGGFHRDDYARSRGSSPSRMNGGPGYADLPSHGEDVKKLGDECNAAREAARVLSEALVFTRPDELNSKPIIQEFYRTCVLAYESLSNQMGWAQAEAERSRERTLMNGLHIGTPPKSDDSHPWQGSHGTHQATMEEEALATLLEAHGSLTEALKQHDDLERMARDEREMKEVRERSKKDTRMDKNAILDAQGSLVPPTAGGSSRSPSPAPHARLPHVPATNGSQPLPVPSRGFAGQELASRSRTPSPDGRDLPPPRKPGSPGRPSSPLRNGGAIAAVPGKMTGPRPLPQPAMFRQANTSDGSLPASAAGHGLKPPSKSGSGSSADGHDRTPNGVSSATPAEEADEDGWVPPSKPTRKALGKRRAVETEESDFNPDDMFLTPAEKKTDGSVSDESITADDVHFAKPPVKYAYDAYQERLEADKAASSQGHGSSAGVTGAEGGGSNGRPRAGTASGTGAQGGSGGSGAASAAGGAA